MSEQQVKLISEWHVRPETEVDESKRRYNLGCSELGGLLIGYLQWVFHFKKPHNFSPSSFLEKLKLCLSQALVHFPPLAGQFVTRTYENEHSCSVYINCHKGPGAKLVHAQVVDLSIDDVVSLKGDILEVVRSFFDVGEMELINYDGHTKSLLSVQVTELADGVIMGISINHCVADGTSALHFLTILSSIFTESPPSPSSSSSFTNNKPVIDANRPIVKLPYLDLGELVIRGHQSRTVEKIFHFSTTSIALLKARASEEASDETKISSFQALAAFVWRGITKARSFSFDERTACGLIANLRPRNDPPLPQEYLGSLLMVANATAEVGELLGSSLGWAAKQLHHAVLSLGDKVSKQDDYCGERVVPQVQLLLPGLRSKGPNPVLFGGSPRFDVYGLEFGLGRAVAAHRGFHNKNGMVSAFPGAKGDGSVDLQVCLAPQTMSLLSSDTEFLSFASDSTSFDSLNHLASTTSS